MTRNPATLTLCPGCGYQTLAPTGHGLACLDCDYTHHIPELAITPEPEATK